MNRKIWLIGYRCCGKTTVGRLLSGRLGCGFVDTDHLIQEAAGKGIWEIVKEWGWTRFRELERETMEQLLGREEMAVIACGGGAVLHREVMERISATSFVVWLKADPEEICIRMAQDPSTSAQRPRLTQQETVRKEVEETLSERIPLYERFSNITVDTSAMPPEQVADAIISAYSEAIK